MYKYERFWQNHSSAYRAISSAATQRCSCAAYSSAAAAHRSIIYLHGAASDHRRLDGLYRVGFVEKVLLNMVLDAAIKRKRAAQRFSAWFERKKAFAHSGSVKICAACGLVPLCLFAAE